MARRGTRGAISPTATSSGTGLREPPHPAPTALVVFGASGDLATRKLLPALWHLEAAGRLPERFAIVGVGRTRFTTDQFQQRALEAVAEFPGREPSPPDALQRFARLLHYVAVDYDSAGDFARLAASLAHLNRDLRLEDNLVFYLATPPDAYPVIAERLREAALTCDAGMREGIGARRIVVEKPFGRDAASAEALNRELRRCFPEPDIYRIDHYLGKETVQNVLVFRFGNGIFEPVWNRRYVDHVQITVAETVGVEHRAQYYETAGALRDMLQNHLLQLLCLIAMEPPSTLAPEAVRDEKTKVLDAVRDIRPDHVDAVAARGQYGPGYIAGLPARGYREEPRVASDSRVETFAALKLEIDNWRWAGVPFYLRSGKRLARRVSEIAIQFKEVPHRLFRPDGQDQIEPNTFALRIQPNEGIALRFQAKAPGLALQLRTVSMEFRYGAAFGRYVPDAYERLLLDCLLGDPTLFARSDWIDLSWRLLDPVLAAWESGEVESYEAGTWGPESGRRLIERDGRRWHRL